MLWIRMMQGLIARHRGGKSVARLYFKECLALLTDDYSDLATERDRITKTLDEIDELEKKISSPGWEPRLERHEHLYPLAFPNPKARRLKAPKQVRDLKSLPLIEIKKVEDFIQIVREYADE